MRPMEGVFGGRGGWGGDIYDFIRLPKKESDCQKKKE